MRDPTQPPVARSAAPDRVKAVPELRVEAIVVDGERRIAIVDGKLVRAGDRVGAAVITEITSDSVEYSRDGRKHSAPFARKKLSVRRERAPNEDRS